MKTLLTALFTAACLVPAHAAVIAFDLTGTFGAGLLSGNENGTINGSPGSGGEFGSTIFFNDADNLLTLNVGWGSANGFINLSGNATAGHIHGPTASGGVAAFSQNASVRYPLDNIMPGWNPSASSGGFNGSIAISAADVAALLNGQFYLNIHTAANPGGEIRGQLVPVPVPEPSTYALLGMGVGATLLGLRRRQR